MEILKKFLNKKNGLKIGIIGMGRMGSNIALNILDHNHKVVVYNRTKERMASAVAHGAEPAESIPALVHQLSANGKKGVEERRVILILITAGNPLTEILEQLTPLLKPGDIIIDGANSYYKDSQKRYLDLKEKGISFMDCGVSGGIHGAREGACLMMGGDKESFDYIEPLMKDIVVTGGLAYLGASGAGHYVKMVHNAIEYGMMSALAQGFDTIKNSEFDIDLKKVATIYNNGSILEGELTNYLEQAFYDEGYLERISGSVPKGETEEEMKKINMVSDMTILNESLKIREASRTTPSYVGKLISAMRNKFGGHSTNTLR